MKHLILTLGIFLSLCCNAQVETTNHIQCRILSFTSTAGKHFGNPCTVNHTLFSVPAYDSSMGSLELRVSIQNKQVVEVWYGCKKCQMGFIHSLQEFNQIEITPGGFIAYQTNNSSSSPNLAVSVVDLGNGRYQILSFIKTYADGVVYVEYFSYPTQSKDTRTKK